MRAGLALVDHEALSRALLEARGGIAQTCATVTAVYPRSLSLPINKVLRECLKQLDQARELLAEALCLEHPSQHPGTARRSYFPQQ